MNEALAALAGLALISCAALTVLWRRQARRTRLLREQIRQSEEREQAHLAAAGRLGRAYQQAAAAADELLLIVDPQLTVQAVNPAATRRFGELTAGSSLILYSQSLELEMLAKDALGLRQAEEFERIFRLEDRPHRARAVATPDGLAIALADISDVQRLSRARQDMVANLSHELRTPLTSLRLLAETLNTPTGRSPHMVERLTAKMIGEVDTLHQMVQEMLDLAALESGQQLVRMVCLPLRQVAEQAAAVLQAQAMRKQVQIRIEVDPGLMVLADGDQARRAVVNVLHNAVKFSPAGGEIELRGRSSPDQAWVVLSILDGGPGIAPADLDRIFERFYRADRARGTPGTGLGLAIARHILRAHGGRIWAENRPPPADGAVIHLAFQPG